MNSGWAGRDAWCILHTAYGPGAHFQRARAAWLADPQRPRMLHYVALAAHSDALGSGQHRISFDAGRVLLTLCVGSVVEMLREQQFDADALVVDWPYLPTEWGAEWVLKALARRCRRGTQLRVLGPSADAEPLFRQCGFALLNPVGAQPQSQRGVFDPRWEIKTSREPWRQAQTAPQRCMVIGAGIAGASVAASLARRGWQVDVLDQAASPAQGASGLPVGLVCPLVSKDDNLLSRFIRSGVRLSLQQAEQLLQAGRDWARSGVQEQRFDETALEPVPPVQHDQAGWIKPAALVQAWLAQAGIRFMGGAQAHRLRRDALGWTVLDAHGNPLASAPRVVLANASGALPLLQRLQASQPPFNLTLNTLPAVHNVRGMVSWAAHKVPERRPFPATPINGNGSLIPFVPFDDGMRWFVGASYQPITTSKPEWPDDKNHGANVLRLEKLLPTLSDALAPVFEAGGLQAWKGVRCVTADRLPMVGSVMADDPSLWIYAGLGSRGLSYAALCAELLAAQWAGEPLPVEAALAQAVGARRKRPVTPP